MTKHFVRYCPACGSIGPVPKNARDCCPDGSHAVMVPKAIAEQAALGFKTSLEEPRNTAFLAEIKRRADEVNREFQMCCGGFFEDIPESGMTNPSQLDMLCWIIANHFRGNDCKAVTDVATFLEDVARSRYKYPDTFKMFDGLIGEVKELRADYDDPVRRKEEAFDVATCAFRIAVDGDKGMNTCLESVGRFTPYELSVLNSLQTWLVIHSEKLFAKEAGVSKRMKLYAEDLYDVIKNVVY